MKAICLVIHSLGIGGMERVMSELANDFSGRVNTEVHLILIGKKRQIKYAISDSVIIHKPDFEFSNNRRKFDTLRTVFFLRSKVKSINPDAVLSFGEIWNNLVLIALRDLNYPVFISDRSQPGKNLGRLHNFLRRKLYPRAAGYIAQTQTAKEVCLANGWNSNIKVIGNPIRSIPSNGQVEKENIVLSVGRLIKTKHFDHLIRMFVEIADQNWKLAIVGGDAKKQQLSNELGELIKKLGAKDKVFLEGEQNDIDSYYRKSKIFAFTSSSEGFPNVIGEALSAGLPVVAYDCVAGPSDMITDGANGFLIPLFDQQMFKQRLNQLINNDGLRMELGYKAKEKVMNYDISSIADQFFEFLTGVWFVEKQRLEKVQ